MKKMIIAAVAILMVGMTVTTFAGVRVVEGTPDSSNVFSITITDYSRLSSVQTDLLVASETNSFTTTVEAIYPSGTTNSMTYGPVTTDVIQGTSTDVARIYNSDQDTTTYHTQWLKPGDVLKFTGNDGTQAAYSNVYYRVVLEKAE